MSTLILKAASANIKQGNSDLNIGRTSSESKTAPLHVKTKPGIFYRLIDEKTGQIVQPQTLLRKGKTLQVVVDQKVVLELEDFFNTAVDGPVTLANLPGYLVDTSTNADTEWGLISPASASSTPVNGQDMVWTTGMPVAHTLEPQAIGLPAVAALSGGFVGMGGLAGLGAVAASAVALGGSVSGGGAAGGGLTVLPKIVGTLVAGPVNSNGNGDLTVDAYDNNGNKLGTASVKSDGSFEITLNRAYSGVIVLKAYDKDTTNADKPTHLDEANNTTKTLNTLLAVLNFSGTTITGVKVTPLTHAASLKAGVTLKTDGTLDLANISSTKITEANTLVAKALGLSTSNLITADIDTTENKADANAKFNDYGVLLNLFSQLENNGLSMDAIANGINSDGSLSAALIKALNQAGASALQSTNSGYNDLLNAIQTKIGTLTGNKIPVGTVTVSGDPKQGQTLTADLSTIANIKDDDGLPPKDSNGAIDVSKYKLQWQAYDNSSGQWRNIEGETTKDLTLTQDQVAKKVRLLVSYTDGKGNEETVASQPTSAVVDVNDAPMGSDKTLTVAEDNGYTFKAEDFGFKRCGRQRIQSHHHHLFAWQRNSDT